MSTGGINSSQVTALPQQPAPVSTLPATAGTPAATTASTTSTAYVPANGNDAGSVSSSGGDGIPARTAIIAGATAISAARQQAMMEAARTAYAAIGPTADTSGLGQANASSGAGQQPAASGPAAWGPEWSKKLQDAGVDAATIQSLDLTGANGADATQLQQFLDQVTKENDQLLAEFEHDHPEQFQTLAAVKGLGRSLTDQASANPLAVFGIGGQAVAATADSDRAALVKIANAVKTKQLDDATLDMTALNAGKSKSRAFFDSMVLPNIVWGVIPAYGAVRVLAAPFTGGRDPLTREKLFGDPMTSVSTVLMAAGGAMTIANNVKGALQVANGFKAISAGGDAATVWAREGVKELTAGQKLLAYLPGTKLNQQMLALGRLDDLKAGIDALKVGSLEKDLANGIYKKILSGDIKLTGDPVLKPSWWGFQPNSRGFIVGNVFFKKEATKVLADGVAPQIVLDGRTTGKSIAAHVASLGYEFADDATKAKFAAEAAKKGIDLAAKDGLSQAKSLILGTAGKQLLDANAIARPTGISGVLSKMRPGGLQDTLWAVDNLAKDTVGKVRGWKGLPNIARKGIGLGIGLLAVGAFVGSQLLGAKEAGAGTATGTIDTSQLSAEDKQALQQFAAMSADQQQQIIQKLQTDLDALSQTQSPTADQQQQIESTKYQIQLLTQVAQQAAAAGSAAPAATASTTPTVQSGTTGGGGYTAAGLGLG